MNKLWIDLETFSTIPITSGVYKYSEKAEVLLFAYAYNNGPVKIWDCTKYKMPLDLKSYLSKKDILWIAHNTQFDRVIIEKVLNICTVLGCLYPLSFLGWVIIP